MSETLYTEIIKVMLDRYQRDGWKMIDGKRWPINNEYNSGELPELPRGAIERDHLRNAITEAFEPHFPVQQVWIARSVDAISVYPKMTSDRTPKSIRLS